MSRALRHTRDVVDDFVDMTNAIPQRDWGHIHSIYFDPARGITRIRYMPLDYRAKYKEPNPAHSGWVYFVRSGEHVKIGYSREISGRLATIQTSSPHKLQLLMAIQGDLQVEGDYHSRFSEIRAHGEWYRLEGALLDYLAEEYELQKAGVTHR